MSVSSLNWDHHLVSVQSCFSNALNDPVYSDVTLVSDDFKSFQGHKVILSSCSKVFMELLKLSNPQSSPMIYLRGFSSNQISNILKFIYQGSVEVPTSDLTCFVEKAEELQLLNIRTKRDETGNGVTKEEIEEAYKEVNASNIENLKEVSMKKEMVDSLNSEEISDKVDLMVDQMIAQEMDDSLDSEGICDKVDQMIGQAPEYSNNDSFYFDVSPDDSMRDEKTKDEHINSLDLDSEEPRPEKNTYKADPHIESLLAEVHSYKGFHHCPHSGCDYKAKRKELIRNHLSSTHGGPKFYCPYQSCNRIYSNGGNLRSHTKSYHSCDKCPEKYEFNKDLRKHKKALHPNPYIN